ncbi:c-type cytochrome [Piscinibacter sp.]|uniref:c-type cytochrome n=1 Tax=Piscinibacter sp. TaxID=1903157 RepID=UPI002C61C479|nr:c-type cytochrome [Albitalea sp.]HUG25404.1 c-type cytochrome [Albitalea sp.]
MKPRPKHLVAALAVAAVLVALVVGDPFADPPARHALQPDNARVLAQGRRIYEAQCVACHGARLEGQPNWRERGPDGRLPAPPHDASGHTWHHPDELLFRLTKFGVAKVANLKGYVSAMPVYEGILSDEEIVAVLSWIKSQWPAEIRARHDEINQQAQQ